MMFEEKKYVCGNQWAIDTIYPDYQELFPLLDVDRQYEYSHETTAFNAEQYPLWTDPNLSTNYRFKIHDNFVSPVGFENQLEKIVAWAQAKMLKYKFFHTLRPAISWYVSYNEGGWQGMHTHDSNCITQIIYLDGLTHMTPDSPAKEAGWGAMYALMASKDKTKYLTFNSFPGRCIMLPGNVYHGVHPVKSLPRRTVVIDYIYKTI